MKDSKTIFLLVEDDDNDAYLMQRLFTDKSMPTHIKLVRVQDGLEAKEYVEGSGKYRDREDYPPPDVILLDLKLPRWSGFQFLEWLRKEGNGQHLLPVIVLTSSAEPEDVQRAYHLGVNCYLVKPVDWRELQTRIRTLGMFWGSYVEKPVPVIQRVKELLPTSRSFARV